MCRHFSEPQPFRRGYLLCSKPLVNSHLGTLDANSIARPSPRALSRPKFPRNSQVTVKSAIMIFLSVPSAVCTTARPAYSPLVPQNNQIETVFKPNVDEFAARSVHPIAPALAGRSPVLGAFPLLAGSGLILSPAGDSSLALELSGLLVMGCVFCLAGFLWLGRVRRDQAEKLRTKAVKATIHPEWKPCLPAVTGLVRQPDKLTGFLVSDRLPESPVWPPPDISTIPLDQSQVVTENSAAVVD